MMSSSQQPSSRSSVMPLPRAPKITLERLVKFVDEGHYREHSIKAQIYTKIVPVKNMSVYSHPQVHERPSPSSIIQRQHELQWRPAAIGDSFGPSWSTHWFKIELQIPNSKKDWQGQEIHFRWDSSSEALIFNQEGMPLQGLTGGDGWDKRHEYSLIRSCEAKEHDDVVTIFVEMACNGLFGAPSEGSMIMPPDPERRFALKKCDLAVFDREAFDLYMNFRIISEMAKECDPDSIRGNQALAIANRIMDICYADMKNRDLWRQANQVARQFLSQQSGSPHVIHAVGHCHIDLCWLWPFAETVRKACRSFTSQLVLIDKYPEYKFAQSQAQLYAWMKDHYPETYEKIKQRVKEGRFIPVGGSWVEMDGIITGGESACRQLLYGQRFYQKEFGMMTDTFWLPDSFGYSGQLPQILRLSGITRFVTQKLSWNLINKFPNSTFWWRGLDGSEVLSHFPPADTYVAKVDVTDLLFNIKNFKEKDLQQNASLMLFGWGDGGGGPTYEHCERLERCASVEGLPKVTSASPTQFFDAVERDAKQHGLRVYDGELYLEGHRGTYTAQASIKKSNRKSEFLLREVELLSVLASLASSGKLNYPREKLEEIWKLVLLCQFHDCLPGSSIKLAYDEAHEMYAKVRKVAGELRHQALEALGLSDAAKDSSKFIVFNMTSQPRTEVIQLPRSKSLTVVHNVPPFGWTTIDVSEHRDRRIIGTSAVESQDKPIVLENSFVRATFDEETGAMTLFDKRAKRTVVQNGNRFLLFSDTPLFWDAWDVEVYDLTTRREIGRKPTFEFIEQGPLRTVLRMQLQLTETSRLTQHITLTAVSSRIDFRTEIDWIDEKHTCLRVAFPTTLRSTEATYEVQFGHVRRPTHRNTSWDVARFEVHGHKYVDLSEYGFGLSLLNDCKYGFACENAELTMTLLKSPKAPDDTCDMGHHEFTYSLYPHVGSFQEGGTISEAYALNAPLQVLALSESTAASPFTAERFGSFFMVDQPNVVIESVKQAEDSDAIVVRMYDAFGGASLDVARLHLLLPGEHTIRKAVRCNVLEQDEETELPIESSGTTVNVGIVKTFEIVTVKLYL